MSANSNQRAAAYLPLLTVGICLNTIGIALPSLGWARYVLMGAGVAILLMCVVKMAAARK
jgi:hypothetical protein